MVIMTPPVAPTPSCSLLRPTSSMKIRELKAELSSYGVCAINILEKSDLIHEVDSAREKRGLKVEPPQWKQPPKLRQFQQPKNVRHDQTEKNADAAKRLPRRADDLPDIKSMSVRELKLELESCNISTNTFVEKKDMQDALMVVRRIANSNSGPRRKSTTRKPASTKSKANNQTETPSDVVQRCEKHVKSKRASHSNNSAGRGSNTGTSRSTSDAAAQVNGTRANTHNSNRPTRRMPQSYIPVDIFDSGTDGGLMGGAVGDGLGAEFMSETNEMNNNIPSSCLDPAVSAAFADVPVTGDCNSTDARVPGVDFEAVIEDSSDYVYVERPPSGPTTGTNLSPSSISVGNTAAKRQSQPDENADRPSWLPNEDDLKSEITSSETNARRNKKFFSLKKP